MMDLFIMRFLLIITARYPEKLKGQNKPEESKSEI